MPQPKSRVKKPPQPTAKFCKRKISVDRMRAACYTAKWKLASKLGVTAKKEKKRRKGNGLES